MNIYTLPNVPTWHEGSERINYEALIDYLKLMFKQLNIVLQNLEESNFPSLDVLSQQAIQQALIPINQALSGKLGTVAHDTTITGSGTVASPLSVVPETISYTPVHFTPTSNTIDGFFEGIDNAL